MIETLVELDNIYDQREKYSVEWAFRNAHVKINQMFKHLSFDSKFREDKACDILRSTTFYGSVIEKSMTLLTVLEFLFSVLMVIGITEMSHIGETSIHSKNFSFLVIIVFALIKVFFEQFLLRPKMEALGWRLYRKTVHNMLHMTSKE
jgi:hypothetical protein